MPRNLGAKLVEERLLERGDLARSGRSTLDAGSDLAPALFMPIAIHAHEPPRPQPGPSLPDSPLPGSPPEGPRRAPPETPPSPPPDMPRVPRPERHPGEPPNDPPQKERPDPPPPEHPPAPA